MSELEATSKEASEDTVDPESVVPAPSRSDNLPAEGRRTQKRATKGAPKYFVSGFWRRGLAGFVDLLVILPVSLLLCKVAGSLAGLSLPPSRVQGLDFWLDLLLAGDGTLIGALGLTLAIASLYSLIFHISMGRTIGMRALKLRIIDVYGDQPSTNRALARTAGYVLAVASLGLGFIWIAFDSEKRGLHDWLAGTYVVKDLS
jgi:uncharacterized RDD family membrane protein YckC